MRMMITIREDNEHAYLPIFKHIFRGYEMCLKS